MANFDVIFVGGGPAGYVGAIRCAQLGLTVGVVEREGLGGTCVLWGCIPAKALLEAASIAKKVAKGAEFGVKTEKVTLDYGVAMKRSRAVSSQNSKGVEFLFKRSKITWIKGTGSLGAGKTVKVTDADGKSETHTARKAIVIATGSRVKGLPQIGLEINKTTIISSDEALTLEKPPGSVAVIGAGAVGCEFADVFNAFGAKVTLLEVMPRILPIEDEDCSAELTKAFKKRGIAVVTGAKLGTAKVAKGGVTIPVEAGGEKKDQTFDLVLVAAGRAPNVEIVGLKEAGVQTTERGFIKVNERLETTAKGIYAIGDVAGQPMLAHKGSREGHVVAEIIAGAKYHPVNYGNIPNATYCHPEVASIGLTEAQCKEKGLKYKVGKFPFSANGRARTSGETEGFVKIIRDEKYGEILGAHISGPTPRNSSTRSPSPARTSTRWRRSTSPSTPIRRSREAIAEAVLDSMGKMLHA